MPRPQTAAGPRPGGPLAGSAPTLAAPIRAGRDGSAKWMPASMDLPFAIVCLRAGAVGFCPPSGVQSERTNDVFESRWRPFSRSDIYNPLLFYVAASSRRPNKNRHLRKRLPRVLPSHSLQPEVTLSEFAKWQKHFLWSWLPCLRSRSLRTLPVRMTYGAAKSPSAWPILTAPPQPPLAAIPWTVWPSSCGAGGRSPDAPRHRSRRLRYLWVWGRCSRPLADEPPLH